MKSTDSEQEISIISKLANEGVSLDEINRLANMSDAEGAIFYEDIAKRLNITNETARKRIQLARKHIRQAR
ncbi:MAG: hypothetical protein KZQ92_10735 [Candidatus Thiodiazotropha sp. (ex Lucinoma borealis)]|nr:hypothetical protein [Candidatus Thiodiazotropha sp. (ex Lucinoma borealis)]MCU7842100.1 hypothetical protein [Candidatus Thiodiazotropha sp. (ex Troendleina suluensis)]MCU7947017.1 hypothetical protein [Candidatus Thiodiazotropha sp. (ex Cardiolucina cf. quadrata)]MCU7857977.1 hypothetical protein [Candidatus Thiodiazotropha sp. (ex Lucinoma borealis)]MCU7864438.1 hypothetical protein [Candidatus Thiodiazotropha sp. (ex Lucinoma borealis)]